MTASEERADDEALALGSIRLVTWWKDVVSLGLLAILLLNSGAPCLLYQKGKLQVARGAGLSWLQLASKEAMDGCL